MDPGVEAMGGASFRPRGAQGLGGGGGSMRIWPP